MLIHIKPINIPKIIFDSFQQRLKNENPVDKPRVNCCKKSSNPEIQQNPQTCSKQSTKSIS